MVRHPHFTQPIFVRFPRPCVLTGREGAERFPQAEEPSLEHAVLHALRSLDPAVTLDFVKDFCASYEEREILKARNMTLRTRPADVRTFFKSQFSAIIPSTPAEPRRPGPSRLRLVPGDDPYGA